MGFFFFTFFCGGSIGLGCSREKASKNGLIKDFWKSQEQGEKKGGKSEEKINKKIRDVFLFCFFLKMRYKKFSTDFWKRVFFFFIVFFSKTNLCRKDNCGFSIKKRKMKRKKEMFEPG